MNSKSTNYVKVLCEKSSFKKSHISDILCKKYIHYYHLFKCQIIFFYFLIEAITKKEEQKRGGNKRLELGFDDGMGRQINAIRVKMLFIIFKKKKINKQRNWKIYVASAFHWMKRWDE